MFKIEETQQIFDDANDVIDWLRDNIDFDEDDYDYMLDECYPDYEVGYITFTASQILKECDRIAYDIGLNELLDSELVNLAYELDRTDINEVTYFYDYNITNIGEEEDITE